MLCWESSVCEMNSIWHLLVVLALWLALASCQDDLDLDYSNEYDNVRPNLVYPDEPPLDKRLTEAAREFGESIKEAWQSMIDSFHDYFEEIRDVFADGVNDNVETFQVDN